MLKDNLFQKILDKQIPAKIAYEDDRCLAFHDVNPQAPVHVLIIPRKAIATHADLTDGDRDLLGHMHLVAVKLAKQLGLDDGYRIVCYCHSSEFDVRTGEVLEGPAEEPITVYPVRVEDGEIQVGLE